MTAKTYLKQVKAIEDRIERVEDRLATIRSELGAMKSPSYDANRVQTSWNADKTLDLIIKYGSLEKKLLDERERLLAVRERICSEIELLENDQYKSVLYWVYVSHLSWEEIAAKMHYTRRWVEVLHGRALVEFERVRMSS